MMLLISILLASGVGAARNKCKQCEKRRDKCVAKRCSPPPPPPPSPSLPLPSPSPPPPSPPSLSPSPSLTPPACTGHTFTSKANLNTAVTEYVSNATAATAKYGPIAGWCVSGVTDMSALFDKKRNFNADISGWDTSRVTNMDSMFSYATAFNQPLSWDTSRVTNMDSMFDSATAFNQPLSWDTSRVTEMRWMFHEANSLSAANKLLIRCAWADTPAFASAGYGSSWAPGSCA